MKMSEIVPFALTAITLNDFHKICRLCLKNDRKLTDIHTYCPDFNDKIANIIKKCAPVRQIMKSDGLPNSICSCCYNRLNMVYEFHTQILRSEEVLCVYFKTLNGVTVDQNNVDSVGDCKIENFFSKDSSTTVYKRSFDADRFQNTEINTRTITENCQALEYSASKFSTDDWKTRENSNLSQISVENTTHDSCSKDEVLDRDDDLKNVSSNRTKVSDDTFVSNKIEECEICKMKFENVEMSQNHKCTSRKENSLKKRKKQTEIKEGSERYECNVCGKHFQRPDYLKSHKQSHNVGKPYGCDLCDASFKYTSTLRIHKRLHSGDNLYRCDVCGKNFPKMSIMKIHKTTHSDEKPYSCDLCNKRYKRLDHLKLHKLLHTGEKPHQCDVCGKCFSIQHHLIRHRRIHTGEKNYQCDTCHKSFAQMSYLKSHKQIHTGERSYLCDVCDKTFTFTSALRLHKRVHSDEKPYACDVCNRQFKRSEHLKSHKLIHSGEKPFLCNICNKCFSRQNSLIQHKRIHSGEKLYQCDVCFKNFIQLSHLKTHKKVHSGKILNS